MKLHVRDLVIGKATVPMHGVGDRLRVLSGPARDCGDYIVTEVAATAEDGWRELTLERYPTGPKGVA